MIKAESTTNMWQQRAGMSLILQQPVDMSLILQQPTDMPLILQQPTGMSLILRHPTSSPGINHMFEEIPNPSNRPPAVLPDLAPSEFYLFGKLKQALAGQEFESTEALLLAMRDH
jgi:hypothetical protein